MLTFILDIQHNSIAYPKFYFGIELCYVIFELYYVISTVQLLMYSANRPKHICTYPKWMYFVIMDMHNFILDIQNVQIIIHFHNLANGSIKCHMDELVISIWPSLSLGQTIIEVQLILKPTEI